MAIRAFQPVDLFKLLSFDFRGFQVFGPDNRRIGQIEELWVGDDDHTIHYATVRMESPAVFGINHLHLLFNQLRVIGRRMVKVEKSVDELKRVSSRLTLPPKPGETPEGRKLSPPRALQPNPAPASTPDSTPPLPVEPARQVGLDGTPAQ